MHSLNETGEHVLLTYERLSTTLKDCTSSLSHPHLRKNHHDRTYNFIIAASSAAKTGCGFIEVGHP